MSPKWARVEEEAQTNETMQDLDRTVRELEKTRKELNGMTKTMLTKEEDRDMWKRLFEDCNKMQGEEIEHLMREYKERSERLALTTSVERSKPAKKYSSWAVPDGAFDASQANQTKETRVPATSGRVTMPDPSDTLGDPVVEQTVKKLIETAGRLVANRNAPGSGVTAPYGTMDDTGRVQLSKEAMARTGAINATLPAKGSAKVQ